jgi:hypothetical protein
MWGLLTRVPGHEATKGFGKLMVWLAWLASETSGTTPFVVSRVKIYCRSLAVGSKRTADCSSVDKSEVFSNVQLAYLDRAIMT